MNTNPDETKLALWLEDELQGEELAAFEASLGKQPEHIAARAEVRRWRKNLSSLIPASEEPPYPDFFNSRVAQGIRELDPRPAVNSGKRGFAWRSLFMPLAACAGMAMTFMIGAKTYSGPPEIIVAGAPKAIPVEPILYTPERGVKAEWFASSDAAATVIVLDGVAAFPDSMDFSETAWLQNEREMDRTAGLESDASGELSL